MFNPFPAACTPGRNVILLCKIQPLQICRPDPQGVSGKTDKGVGKATNPEGLSVRPVGWTADGSILRIEARHRWRGKQVPRQIPFARRGNGNL